MEQFKKVTCEHCGLEIWYSTINDQIECTRCGTVIPVEKNSADSSDNESEKPIGRF